ncbi:MAG: hypothetical protein NTY46_05155 [Candidatus Sumerlaeota bacterium]|nr:hypothetical protein [Candidatus Sumerlaeota bacterium]
MDERITLQLLSAAMKNEPIPATTFRRSSKELLHVVHAYRERALIEQDGRIIATLNPVDDISEEAPHE